MTALHPPNEISYNPRTYQFIDVICIPVIVLSEKSQIKLPITLARELPIFAASVGVSNFPCIRSGHAYFSLHFIPDAVHPQSHRPSIPWKWIRCYLFKLVPFSTRSLHELLRKLMNDKIFHDNPRSYTHSQIPVKRTFLSYQFCPEKKNKNKKKHFLAYDSADK